MKRRYFFLIQRIIPYILILAVLLLLLVLKPREKEEATAATVVRVWNVDTFEGGKGSRSAFLKKVAKRAEQRQSATYYLISSYTKEGALARCEEGDFPDILSFGVGLSAFFERSLSVEGGFPGGEGRAQPWCCGSYALFSLTDNFEDEGITALSCGGDNIPAAAAALEDINGEELPAIAAYTAFLNGKYRYLLGTQRDLCRFQSRNVGVYYRTLTEFCDLYQYISLLSLKKEQACRVFFEELFSREVQSSLSEIGMYSLNEEGTFYKKAKRTMSVYSSDEALCALHEEAVQIGARKNLEKYLKII